MGKTKKIERDTKEVLELFKSFQDLLNPLDFNESFEKVFHFLQKTINCDRGLWFCQSAFDYFLEEAWRPKEVTEIDDIQPPPNFWVSRVENFDFLSKLCREVSNKVTYSFWTLPTPMMIESETAGQGAFLPAIHPVSGELMGYLFCFGGNKADSKSFMEDIWPHLQSSFSRFLHVGTEHRNARELSFIDDVTQLYNQRYLHLVLEKEIRRCERSEGEFSVLFIDIDRFKLVNDTNGHLVGSKLLAQVSEILKRNIRMMDFGFRYGGDEFVLILTSTPKETAIMVGERIRQEIEAHPFEIDGKTVRLTLSIGLASYPEHARSKEDILRIADEAMYLGKHKSRNIVSVAS